MVDFVQVFSRHRVRVSMPAFQRADGAKQRIVLDADSITSAGASAGAVDSL
jgi:hypothetical protein